MSAGLKKSVLKSSSKLRTSKKLLGAGALAFLEKISFLSRFQSRSSL